MVYQRVRNSRYASYSRACDAQGRRAQFSIPMRTANFSPYDMLNHAVSMGGDMLGHVGQAAGQAANRFTEIPYQNLGGELGSKLGGAWDTVSQQGGNMLQGAQDAISGAVRGAGEYFGNNPMAANAGKAAAGLGGIAAGGAGVAKVADRLGQGAGQVAEVVEDAAPAVMGLRQRAGALLKNPYAQAGAGAAALGAGAYGANQMMNRDQ